MRRLWGNAGLSGPNSSIERLREPRTAAATVADVADAPARPHGLPLVRRRNRLPSCSVSSHFIASFPRERRLGARSPQILPFEATL